MKPRPACLPCILHQTLQVAREVSDDEWSQRKVLNEVLRALPEAEWHQSSPAEILNDALASARGTLKVKQPYAERRAKVQEQFAGVAKAFRERLAKAEDPFALATLGAAAANLVDELVFSRFAKLDSKVVFEDAVEAGFARGSADDLRKAVDGATKVLYMLDNAGEVLLDALLIEQIRALGKHVRVVVRGGGLLHDATIEDLAAAGLAPEETDAPEGEDKPIPDVIELPPGALNLPTLARSTDLGAAVEDSDLVIAKGSANYQTLRCTDTTVIHLLRAKCDPVAKSLAVSKGSLVVLVIAASP